MSLLRRDAGGNYLEKASLLISRRIGNIGMVVFMALALLMGADVILRRLFNSPLSFSFELIELMLVIVFLFSLTYCTRVQRHVSIDLFVSRFPPGVRRATDLVTDIITMILFGLACWRIIIQGIHIWELQQTTLLLKIPFYPFLFIAAFGCILSSLNLLIKIVSDIAEEVVR